MKIELNELVTARGARQILGCSSRNTVEYWITKGKIRVHWIDEHDPWAIRLLSRSDVEALKEGA